MQLQFETLNDIQCSLGEGPVYDARRDMLFYCDIPAKAVHGVQLATGETRTWTFPTDVGSLGVCESGRVLVALRHAVVLFDIDTGKSTEIATVEEGRTETRLNDGKVGPDGAFWVGTMDDREIAVKEPIGSLYRITADGKVERKVEGVVVSNGLAFSPDGRTMFHSDSRARWIDRWDLEPATGAISNRTRIASLDDATGRPDGAAMDAEGCYWSAGVSAARLNRFAPDGTLVAHYPVPVAAPTMPCFVGADLRTLVVTSLRAGRAPELLARYPLTGITLRAPSPVAGAPVSRFRD